MITFNQERKSFHLETKNSSYIISIHRGIVVHNYYGAKIPQKDDVFYLTRADEIPYGPQAIEREKLSFLDLISKEISEDGLGDFRETSLAITDYKGNNAVELTYKSHKITKGTIALPGLPCVFSDNSKAETLEIITEDKILGAEVSLFYTLFDDTDAIVRFTKINNTGKNHFFIKKAYSASLDLNNNNYDVITLHGSWARERHIDRHSIHMGNQGVSSKRGVSSHQEHPFIAVLDHNADYDKGNVYGMNFIYSGNFVAEVQRNQFDFIRMVMGINPEYFCWKLEPQETFYTPQAVLVYSDNGLNGMTHSFHDLYREHLIRSPYKKSMRPVLINNWEATYFDFNTKKLLDIAKEAKKDGIEMLVMDDGWFGKRNTDNCSLGDWTVNETKINGGLKHLVDEVNKLGMKFGIWFEPEMVNPDSELYRAHPDYAVQIKDRSPSLSRNQLILNITKKEVRENIYSQIKAILNSANIEYIKWDMNRQITDVGDVDLPEENKGEFYHRYVLALYEMQERLITEFPNLLLENCSSGGGRFDPGMLYYSPQIWCSDDTDAIERLSIQEGTALIYPLSTIGAHVSVCPNHAVGRSTPFKTRGYVALSGTFGYELDITKLSDDERKQIPQQIELYKKYSSIIQNGDYYRIESYQTNGEIDCWLSISKDKKRALITFVQVLNHPGNKSRIIKPYGLDESFTYKVTYLDKGQYQEKCDEYILSGAAIMNAGLKIQRDWGDFNARLIYLEKYN